MQGDIDECRRSVEGETDLPQREECVEKLNKIAEKEHRSFIEQIIFGS